MQIDEWERVESEPGDATTSTMNKATTLEEQVKWLEKKIAQQRIEIKNRVIEIHNLQSFKRHMESLVFQHCPTYKYMPINGILEIARERDSAVEKLGKYIAGKEDHPRLGMLAGNDSQFMWVCFGDDVRIGTFCKLVGVLASKLMFGNADCTSVTNANRGSCGWVTLLKYDKH